MEGAICFKSRSLKFGSNNNNYFSWLVPFDFLNEIQKDKKTISKGKKERREGESWRRGREGGDAYMQI
jgi:hypothetical protein